MLAPSKSPTWRPAVKSTALPPGSACGQRCVTSPAAGSGVVRTSGVPPADGHARQAHAGASRREEDRPVLAPGPAPVVRRIAERDGGAARDRDLLELAVGEEAEPLPVGREERVAGAFGPRQRGSLQLLEPPHVELRRWPPAFCAAKASSLPSGERIAAGPEARGQATRPRPARRSGARASRARGRPPGRPAATASARASDARQRRPRQRAPPERQRAAAARRPRPSSGAPLECLLERHARLADVVQRGSSGCAPGSAAAGGRPTAASRPAARSTRLARQHRGEHVRHRLAVEEPLARQHLEQHARRRPRCRRACRRACRGPARATCRRRCRGSGPRRCPCARGWGTATSRSSSRRRRLAAPGLGEAEVEDLDVALGARP